MAYVEILVGTNKLSSGGTRYSIKNTIPHEHYDEPEYAHDIALIRLRTPIEFNENIQPITYSTTEVPENTEMQVFGFGRLAVSGLIFQFLMRMHNEIITNV